MMYKSTRGGGEQYRSAAAILHGIAADGGLFMPDSMPYFNKNDYNSICGMSYPERAAFVLSRFLDDYSRSELIDDCGAAYSQTRFKGYAAPVVPLDKNISILELWHGPTCAFKDMALQIMPRLLSRALVKMNETRTACILVATSGDTGKAALEGYRDADNVKITVYYPVNGVSHIQKLQMATQEGDNVWVCSVQGNFDITQSGIKKILADNNLCDRLSENGYFLSSANSINWGRLAPQIVYYISAYCDMINNGDIKNGDSINVCVPTGNFGNIFAAYLAKICGLPIHKLICASNRNNILTDFLNTGTYDRNRCFYTTMSPSMDILISSNLERLLYLAAGSTRTAEYMRRLGSDGVYTIESDVKTELDNNFYGGFCSEEETSAMIKKVFEEYNYLIDTHTAVGLHCAQQYIRQTGDTRRMLAVSTASPYKFASNVYLSLTGSRYDDEFMNLNALSELTHTEIPDPLANLTKKSVRFDPESAIEADDMKKELLRFLGMC